MKQQPAPTTAILLLCVSLAAAMAAAAVVDQAGAPVPATYLVFVDAPPPGVPSRPYHLGILTAALGSEEKAKAAIIYNYRNVVSGFSARVTPAELEAIKKQPQVNRVLPSATLHLMSTDFDDVS